jgi:hypothetical protein
MPFHVSNFMKSRREVLTKPPFCSALMFAQRLLFRLKVTRRNEFLIRPTMIKHADINEHPDIAAL